MLKSRIKQADEVDITPMIDVVFQLIIFFMVVMAIAVVYGVAIKFPPPGKKGEQSRQEKEKRLVVYVQQDRISSATETGEHITLRDGILKLNGEEIIMTRTDITEPDYWKKWAEEREEAYDKLQTMMEDRILDEDYKTDLLLIQGDMKTYHGKVMRVIDRGKRVKTNDKDPETGEMKIGIDGFSLVPPDR